MEEGVSCNGSAANFRNTQVSAQLPDFSSDYISTRHSAIHDPGSYTKKFNFQPGIFAIEKQGN